MGYQIIDKLSFAAPVEVINANSIIAFAKISLQIC